ncbi:MAG: hypothetical protein EWV40_11660 [Microcystis flos-aquae Mf_WU_F_19750830_S460]|uniref:Uncharacterized protein n=1 Tax=Microcystis flos-aquae Mf_WU_F_19750830_S460 TaxID=2486237 RepID=A0A552LMU7_9CHRO|nr:MAG: hypothetical protein EWV40_11660 [Microcystis flos-aquae Mf_WU_F_19750830_S460]
MYTGLGKLSIQSEKWRSGVVMFLNVKFCYEIQHFWQGWHSYLDSATPENLGLKPRRLALLDFV